jgi:hypothetical protein
MTAILLSPFLGLAMSLLMLVLAFLSATLLPDKEQTDLTQKCVEPNKLTAPINVVNPVRPLIFLCLFIVIITINSGLMYQVTNPAFGHLQWLVSWYWAVPYIIALYIMKNLPGRISRTYILYVAIAMIGFSFIFFMVLDRSAAAYLVVNTLMLGACGVYDLFWWSILGEMLQRIEGVKKKRQLPIMQRIMEKSIRCFAAFIVLIMNPHINRPANCAAIVP